MEVEGPEVLKPTTELDLVLRCVTAALSRLTGAVEPSQIVWDGPEGFDEHRFLRLCRHHRVTPLVGLVIKRLKPGLSSWLSEVLRDQSRREERLRVPGGMHTALILLAHGTKHLWNRLIYLTDFALACERLQEGLQEELATRLKELRFLQAFKLAQALRQLLLDRDDAGLVSAEQEHQVLIERIMGWLESGREFTRAELAVEQAKMHLALKECWSDRLKYAWRMGVVPNWDELEAWPTSPVLFWLYYIYRPFRLWRRYGLRALREIASKA